MVVLGLLGRLLGKREERPHSGFGVRVRSGTDYVKTPIRCPKCSRVVARRTPERGLARCECGHEFAIINYEARPLPKDTKLR